MDIGMKTPDGDFTLRVAELIFFYLMKSTDVQIKNETCTDQQEENHEKVV